MVATVASPSTSKRERLPEDSGSDAYAMSARRKAGLESGLPQPAAEPGIIKRCRATGKLLRKGGDRGLRASSHIFCTAERFVCLEIFSLRWMIPFFGLCISSLRATR